MHNRLLPLTPPQPPFGNVLPRFAMSRVIVPSMPWLELGFFAMLIFGLASVGG